MGSLLGKYPDRKRCKCMSRYKLHSRYIYICIFMGPKVYNAHTITAVEECSNSVLVWLLRWRNGRVWLRELAHPGSTGLHNHVRGLAQI